MAKKKDLEGQLAAFVQQYARKSYPNIDPNDRRYDRKIEQLAARMDPEDFGRLIHGSDDEDLDKEPAVFELLMRLRQMLGTASFQIVDHWPSDRTMIGVAHPRNHRVLACLVVSSVPGSFDVHLELPASVTSNTPYTPAGEFSGLPLEAVAEQVRLHLARADEL